MLNTTLNVSFDFKKSRTVAGLPSIVEADLTKSMIPTIGVVLVGIFWLLVYVVDKILSVSIKIDT